jgi:YD repeat-containing protein
MVSSRAWPERVCARIDANGNLTSDGTKTYYWNALNQLVEVKEGSTAIATFEYDGFGRRTEKVAAGLTHQYIYDAEDIAEERISGSSSDTIRYYHGVGVDELVLALFLLSEVITIYRPTPTLSSAAPIWKRRNLKSNYRSPSAGPRAWTLSCRIAPK